MVRPAGYGQPQSSPRLACQLPSHSAPHWENFFSPLHTLGTKNQTLDPGLNSEPVVLGDMVACLQGPTYSYRRALAEITTISKSDPLAIRGVSISLVS